MTGFCMKRNTGLIVIMNLNWKTLFKLFWNYSEKKELYETSSLELFVEIN